MIRTNRRFFCDVQDHAIHAEVLTELKRRSRHSVAPSEIDAWRNSMQFIANILVDQDLPPTAGVSIEYLLQLLSPSRFQPGFGTHQHFDLRRPDSPLRIQRRAIFWPLKAVPRILPSLFRLASPRPIAC
jgi:hypothetical protein